MSIFLPAPAYDPKGPDGRGWNRISIMGLCADECALRPTCESAFWEAQDTRRTRYGIYGPCTNSGNCKTCNRLHQEEQWPWFGSEILVRIDEKGAPWVMNRPDEGWGEYGRPTTWEYLSSLQSVTFERYRDKYGRGIMIRRTSLSVASCEQCKRQSLKYENINYENAST